MTIIRGLIVEVDATRTYENKVLLPFDICVTVYPTLICNGKETSTYFSKIERNVDRSRRKILSENIARVGCSLADTSLPVGRHSYEITPYFTTFRNT